MPSPTNVMHTIGILGGRGMLGADLVLYLGQRFTIEAIDRDNYETHRGRQFDVLINANGNSRRFWANENPSSDFELSTLSVMKSLFDFRYGKYIYISSPDIYEDHASPATTLEGSEGRMRALSPYGFHKRLSEELVKRYADDFLILRSAALLGTRLAKGIVYDILKNNELYVTPDSGIQFITTNAVADIIAVLLEKEAMGEILNVGGIGTVTPGDIAAYVGKSMRVRSDADMQRYEMNTEKIRGIYGALKTSEEYVKVFVKARQLV